MKKICKNCYYWHEYGNGHLPSQLDHTCVNKHLNGGESYYDGKETEHTWSHSNLGTSDIGSYEMIGMGPEFGCIFWEKL